MTITVKVVQLRRYEQYLKHFIIYFYGFKLALCSITTFSVYKKGLIAALMGRTRTAVHAYTSAGILTTFVRARRPEIDECVSIVFTSIRFTYRHVLIDFSITVKAATLIFISGRGSAISSAKQGESGSIYNLLKN